MKKRQRDTESAFAVKAPRATAAVPRSSVRIRSLASAVRVVDSDARQAAARARVERLLGEQDGEDGEGAADDDDAFRDDNDGAPVKRSNSSGGGRARGLGSGAAGGLARRLRERRGRVRSVIDSVVSEAAAAGVPMPAPDATSAMLTLEQAIQSVREAPGADALAAPSVRYLLSFTTPTHTAAPRTCVECGAGAKYTCTRCGTRYCCMACGQQHRETRCMTLM